jgi:DNA-binding GntR family transcriptional regulator
MNTSKDIDWSQLTLAMDDYLPLRDVVFNTLRQGILHGLLPPGLRLMEIQLAKQLGVSRTPVREALRMLELEGLVNTVPRKGAEVAAITQKDLHDVLDVRCALEELAVDLACQTITQEELNKLHELLDKFRILTQKGDISGLAECDVEFHDIIIQSTGNNRLIQLLNNLREQMYRYRLEYLKDLSTHQTLLKEHLTIAKCLEQRDVAAAKLTIRDHINKQYEDVIHNLKKETKE